MYGLPWLLSDKESACQCRRCGCDPSVSKIPCRRKWQPTPIFLPRKSHGQRSLTGYSPWDCQGSDMAGHSTAAAAAWTKIQPLKMKRTIDEVWLRNLTLVTVVTMNHKEPRNLEEAKKILQQCDQALKQPLSVGWSRMGQVAPAGLWQIQTQS